MADRGIDAPSRFLCRHGFTDYMATRLLSRKMKGTSWANIEKLCRALHCTPTELFSYEDDPQQPLPDGHPLQKLKVTDEAGTLGGQIRTLSPEQLEKLRAFVKEIKE